MNLISRTHITNLITMETLKFLLIDDKVHLEKIYILSFDTVFNHLPNKDSAKLSCHKIINCTNRLSCADSYEHNSIVITKVSEEL